VRNEAERVCFIHVLGTDELLMGPCFVIIPATHDPSIKAPVVVLIMPATCCAKTTVTTDPEARVAMSSMNLLAMVALCPVIWHSYCRIAAAEAKAFSAKALVRMAEREH
jgi:hypothetical protein